MISQLSILDIGKGLHVRRIEYQEAIPFLLEIHYARRIPSITDAFGLFRENQIIGVVTYGVPASPSLCFGIAGKENARHVKELNRLVIRPEFNKREREREFCVVPCLSFSQDVRSGNLRCKLRRLGRMASRGLCVPGNKFSVHGNDKRAH